MHGSRIHLSTFDMAIPLIILFVFTWHRQAVALNSACNVYNAVVLVSKDAE